MTASLAVKLTCSQPSQSRSQYITQASHDNTTINSWRFINQGVCAPRGTLRAFPNYDSISAKHHHISMNCLHGGGCILQKHKLYILKITYFD